MYSPLIATADMAFAENRRVRAAVADARAQVRRVLLRYRRHRLLIVSGASDARDGGSRVEAKIRSKIRTGTLPRTDRNGRCWVGKGSGRLCHACDAQTTTSDLEYEVDTPDGGTLLFHADCWAAWRVVAAESVND